MAVLFDFLPLRTFIRVLRNTANIPRKSASEKQKRKESGVTKATEV
jgi:hypothetical protein